MAGRRCHGQSRLNGEKPGARGTSNAICDGPPLLYQGRGDHVDIKDPRSGGNREGKGGHLSLTVEAILRSVNVGVLRVSCFCVSTKNHRE